MRQYESGTKSFFTVKIIKSLNFISIIIVTVNYIFRVLDLLSQEIIEFIEELT